MKLIKPFIAEMFLIGISVYMLTGFLAYAEDGCPPTLGNATGEAPLGKQPCDAGTKGSTREAAEAAEAATGSTSEDAYEEVDIDAAATDTVAEEDMEDMEDMEDAEDAEDAEEVKEVEENEPTRKKNSVPTFGNNQGVI